MPILFVRLQVKVNKTAKETDMSYIKIDKLVEELGTQLKEGIMNKEQYVEALLIIYGHKK